MDLCRDSRSVSSFIRPIHSDPIKNRIPHLLESGLVSLTVSAGSSVVTGITQPLVYIPVVRKDITYDLVTSIDSAVLYTTLGLKSSN